jgi:hypothetical protein
MKFPTDVQGLVWLTDGSGTEWGTEALQVKICKRRLWKGASLSIGAPSGNMEGCSFTGDLERQVFIFIRRPFSLDLREICKRRLWDGCLSP